ncbi:MAG: ABC transporter [Litoreibacter sp.]|nr:ABC transporter [Litoreibacter sp.]
MTGLPLTLAVKELRHDWRGSLCFIAALVGVLAPMLVVLALKNGFIGTLIDRLVEDPSNRELLAVGSGAYDLEFFETIGERGDVAFIVPATRSINTVANSVRNRPKRNLERAVPLIPTAQGDPLLGDLIINKGEAALSETLAEELELAIGDTAEMIIGREIDGVSQNAIAELTVTGIVPERLYSRYAMFISLPDLLAIERFRDDRTLTPETWRDGAEEQDSYASFRLYAERLEDLRALEGALTDAGAQVRPRAENATVLLLFRKNLDILYAAVALIAAAGFWAAMAANLRGVVERQRVSFSFLDLLGLSDRARKSIPVFQSLILVGLGICVTFIIVLIILVTINAGFAGAPQQMVALLGVWDVIGTLILGFVTALTASAWAVLAIDKIGTEEVLRHA